MSSNKAKESVDTSITGHTIWITGAGSGLGKSLALALAENKNFVIVSGRNEKKLTPLKERFPNNILVVPADVSSSESMLNALTSIRESVEYLDMVIACAGTCEYQDGDIFDEQMYRRVFDANFFGVVNTVNAAMPLLKQARRLSSSGSPNPLIVPISSLSSLVAFPRAEAYGASKAAVDYFSNTLRVDLKSSGIDVCLVRPGFIDTPLTEKNDFDMPTMISAEKAAGYVLKAISKRKSIFNFPFGLSAPLQFFSHFPRIWQNYIAPKLIKKGPAL